MPSPSEITSAAEDRLRGVLPGAQSVTIHPTDPPFMTLSFDFDGASHSFRLMRDAGIWAAREWLVNGKPQEHDPKQTSPRFEALVAELLGFTHKQPKVDLKDLRCPVDPRRLFGKIIAQTPVSVDRSTNLIEFSCPQCKRKTGQVTMHLFDIQGDLVKTEVIEPWIKRESSKPWYEKPGQDGASKQAAANA